MVRERSAVENAAERLFSSIDSNLQPGEHDKIRFRIVKALENLGDRQSRTDATMISISGLAASEHGIILRQINTIIDALKSLTAMVNELEGKLKERERLQKAIKPRGRLARIRLILFPGRKKSLQKELQKLETEEQLKEQIMKAKLSILKIQAQSPSQFLDKALDSNEALLNAEKQELQNKRDALIEQYKNPRPSFNETDASQELQQRPDQSMQFSTDQLVQEYTNILTKEIQKGGREERRPDNKRSGEDKESLQKFMDITYVPNEVGEEERLIGEGRNLSGLVPKSPVRQRPSIDSKEQALEEAKRQLGDATLLHSPVSPVSPVFQVMSRKGIIRSR